MERFGRYELVRRIGVGGMAEIFLARSSSLDGFEKDLVIKRIRSELSADEKFSSMFIDEGRISITLSHPNVVQVFDFGEVQGTYYLAMEYVEGCNLLQLSQLPGVKGVGLPPALALHVAVEVLKALDYAHNKKGRGGEELNVIHRDISPQNVLLSFDGNVKLGDFGIAKARGRPSHTTPGMVLGKLAYMAPEHLRGDTLDGRADLFSLGIVLWELLTGRSLYVDDVRLGKFDRILEAHIDPPSTQNPRLPRDLDPVIMRALSREPELRYATAREFGHEIHTFLARHWPEVTLYDLQTFISSHRTELTGEPPNYAASTQANVPPHQPGTLTPGVTVPSGDFAIPVMPTTPLEPVRHKAWSEAVQKLSDSFKRRPSLWVLIKLAETCVTEGDVDSAKACYRVAAMKFAQRGLLAQSLFCCRHLIQLAPGGDNAAVKEFVATVPACFGRSDHELPGLTGARGPMTTLLHDLLTAARSGSQDVGQATPILARLDGAGFAELAATAPMHSFAEGSSIVKQGDQGRTMFLLARGRVLVHVTTPASHRVYLSSLTAGDFFGENGFFTGSPRSATVEALYPSDVFEIDRVVYNRVTANHPEASGILLQFYKERIVETVLAKSPVFGLLDNERRRAAVDRFTPRIFREGEMVIREGARSDQIYLVKDGEAEVFTEAGGKRVDLSKVGPGTLFGEVAALRGIPRTATVRAAGRLEVLELARADFEALLVSEPELRRRVLDVVSQRARDNIDKVMGGSPFANRG